MKDFEPPKEDHNSAKEEKVKINNKKPDINELKNKFLKKK